MKKKVSSLFALLMISTFGGCGDDTQTPIVKDIESISIDDTNSPITIRATTNATQLKALVHYDDGSQADITQAAVWQTDYSKATIFYGKLSPLVNGDGNGGETFVDLSFSYSGLEYANDNLVKIVALTTLDINDSNIGKTPQANVEYLLRAYANYSNGETHIPIDANNSNHIEWSVEGNATIVKQEDGKATIKFLQGDVNVTVKAFEVNATTSYSLD